ncbi:MAG: hypothetical protein F4Z61_04680 [Acidimicrobiia bacterium]|nr:hypothetical protein [Acidimicrobiia bacterium]
MLADSFPEQFLPEMERLGFRCEYRPELGGAELAGALAGVQVLLVRSTPVTAEAIEAADDLAWIIRAGAGYNTIDCQAASRRAIWVSNVPRQNAIAVAELAMGLMLAVDRRIPDNVTAIRRNEWRKKEFSAARGLHGRTLGIVGMGQIGFEVAKRARAFGLKLLTVERPRTFEALDQMRKLGVGTVAGLEELFTVSDIISLHTPSTPETTGMVTADLLARMKPGAWLINTARAELVDEDALLEAVERQDLWVGIDVFSGEADAASGAGDSKLAGHPQVYVTHHIGASTRQAQHAIAAEVVRMLADFARGKARNVVNLGALPPAGTYLTIRHVDRVGVLSGVLTSIKSWGLNLQLMINQVFSGAGTAVAVVQVQGEVSDAMVTELEGLPYILGVTAYPSGPLE